MLDNLGGYIFVSGRNHSYGPLQSEGYATYAIAPKLEATVPVPLLTLVTGDNTQPKGVDIGDIRDAARNDTPSGVILRQRLAIQVLQAASQMDDVRQRKDELAKLTDLFRFGKTQKDIDTRDFLKPLIENENPSKQDCISAMKKLEEPPPQNEDNRTRTEKAKGLIKQAQTIAYPEDLPRQTAERKKLLDEAAELYNQPNEAQPTYATLFLYRRLKNPANVNDNSELDVILALIDRVDPFKPSPITDPYYRTLGVVLDCLKEKDIEKRREILTAFKNDDLYKSDEKIKVVIDGLLGTDLTDQAIQDYVKNTAIPSFFHKEGDPEPKPKPKPGGIPWYTYLLSCAAVPLAGAATALLAGLVRGPGWKITKFFYNLGRDPIGAVKRLRLKPRTESPSEKPDTRNSSENTDKLRDDIMSQERTQRTFRDTIVFRSINVLNLAEDPRGAEEKLTTELRDFADYSGLDPRIKDGRLKISVRFGEPGTPSEGFSKGRLKTEYSGDTLMVELTFPPDATRAEIAADCYLLLYEMERHGKSPEKRFGKSLNSAEQRVVRDQAHVILFTTDLGRTSAPGGEVAATIGDRVPLPTGGDIPVIKISKDGVSVEDTKLASKDLLIDLSKEYEKAIKEMERKGEGNTDRCNEARKMKAEIDKAVSETGSSDPTIRERGLTNGQAIIEKHLPKPGTPAHALLVKDLREARTRGGGVDGARSRGVVVAMLFRAFFH